MLEPPSVDSFKGARILIVEDEWIVATLFADYLTEVDCEIVGPAANVAQALALASAEAIDAALLDLNVRGEAVYPVAEALANRGIPFLFITGYRGDKIIETYCDRPALQKPVRPQKMIQILRDILSQPVK